ncbi:hypothetical protein MZM54_05025 [[Brevibacterium] frigoritolerans]|nr:hypothetical protein [Peribacillus frigoritolerans]
MKGFLKSCIGLLFTISLVGCFGEEYDFTPPSVTLSNDDVIESYVLQEANVSWIGQDSKPIKKETKDILAFAKKQKQMSVTSGQSVNIEFDHGDYKMYDLGVTAWKENEKKELEVQKPNPSFIFPKEKGEYEVVVYLSTDRGSVQYVANVVIE